MLVLLFQHSSCKSKTGFIAPEESLEKGLLSHGVSSPHKSAGPRYEEETEDDSGLSEYL